MPFTRRGRHYLHPAGETQFSWDGKELPNALLVAATELFRLCNIQGTATEVLGV